LYPTCAGWVQDELFVKPFDAASTDVTSTTMRWESAPAWSPSGRNIAFSFTDRSSAVSGIAILDLQTGAQKVLASAPLDSGMFYSNPAWSPDGRQVAFVFSGDIAVINADGSGFHILILGPKGVYSEGRADLSHPSWSPNGHEIAFSVSWYDSNSGIFVSKPDGTHLRRLTRGNDTEPAWSPDGQRLVFVRQPRNTRSTLRVVRSDGRGYGRRLL
ncbi:MAG: hypothetical protein WBB74_03655, partial [Gaiellaceae bacterium]